MKKLILLFISLVAAGTLAQAQQTSLSGHIKDVSGAPIPGAAVFVTGTQNGAVADLDGNFVLVLKTKPSAASTLTVSCLGYLDQVIAIGSKKQFDIVLQDDAQSLEETVVIGYSTIKKKDLTGSLSTVGGADITQRKTQTISQALQGAIVLLGRKK